MRGQSEQHQGRGTERNVMVRYPEYTDHADKSDDWVEQQRLLLGADASAAGAKKKFPRQLHQMLEAVDGSGDSLIVRWLPHGRAFVMLDKTRFEQELLPVYFPQQREWASFQRQLSVYGLLRLIRETAYYHPLLLRGRPNLASIIPRTVIGRHSSRRKYDLASEPDFYAMTWLPDTVSTTIPHPVPSVCLPPSSRMPRPELKTPRQARRKSPPLAMSQSSMAATDSATPSTAVNHTVPSATATSSVASVPSASSGAASIPPPNAFPFSGDMARFAPLDFPSDTIVAHLNPGSRGAQPTPLLPRTLASDTLPQSNLYSSGNAMHQSNLQRQESTPSSLPNWQQFEHQMAQQQEPSHTSTNRSASAIAHPNGHSPDDPERKETLGSFDVSSNESSNKPDTETGMDEMETSSDSRSGTKLAEWADFLQDVDLDTSSGSDGKKSSDAKIPGRESSA